MRIIPAPEIYPLKRKKMANDNHLFSVTCYNVTMLNNKYYNDFFELGQQKINFSFFELCLPDDDPVYTLKKVMEDLDFSGLLTNCSDKGRTGYNPIMMYAVVAYANMRGIRAVDRIVELCERDLAFIWLTKGQKPKRDAFYEFKNKKLTADVLDGIHEHNRIDFFQRAFLPFSLLFLFVVSRKSFGLLCYPIKKSIL